MILTKNFSALATLGGKGTAGAMKLRNLASRASSLFCLPCGALNIGALNYAWLGKA
jgi:hypothetical protein